MTCLPDGPDVELVVRGPDGVLAGAAPGLLVIDTSTIAPDTARALAARCAEAGVAFLDAPVSGGEQGAIAGTLSIMVGGDGATCSSARGAGVRGDRHAPSRTWGRPARAR